MKTQFIKGHFGNTIVVPAVGETVKLARDADHGDWKTAAVRPGYWPTIKAGTEVKVVGHLLNFYGLYIQVEHEGRRYDVEQGYIEK